MSHLVKVAEVDELPPGRGKVLHVEGHDVTIYNLEGRYVATSTASRHLQGPTDTTCEMPGGHFPLGSAVSPDRLRTDELHYQVLTRADGVYVLLEEGHIHAGEEPRRQPAKPRRSRRRK